MSKAIFEKRQDEAIIPVDPFMEHQYQYVFYVTKGNDLLMLEKYSSKYGFRSLKFTVEWITNYNERCRRAIKYTFQSGDRSTSIEKALMIGRKVYGANYSNEMLEMYSQIVNEQLEMYSQIVNEQSEK